MFLKKIQAHGFKSFADKVSIPLDRGINGIVGPNGSGKSNVIDAVRWVMGEQNAKNLRGHIATDIIFAGSANRKPLGMAEVSLVFDNKDPSMFCPPEYQHDAEIILTRRLYGDGRREYLINNKPARLKDLLDFFASTGIGGRSYSMIQQGQVDRILNAKPEDVRLILEEAAGTTVYKKKLEETEKRLEQTQENLSRLQDLIDELERQKNTLSSQVEKAKQYREISQELRDKETRYLIWQFYKAKNDHEVFSTKVAENQTLQAAYGEKIRELESRQRTKQIELDAADPGLAALQEEVSSMREKIARAETIILSSDEKINIRLQRKSEIEKDIHEEQSEKDKVDEKWQLLLSQKSEMEVKLRSMQEFLDSYEEQVDQIDEEANTYQFRVEDLQEELQGVSNRLTSNTLRCETLQKERDETKSHIENLEQGFVTYETQLRRAEESFKAFESISKGATEALKSKVDAKKSCEDEIHSLEEEVKVLRSKQESSKESYFQKKATLHSLKEAIAQAGSCGDIIKGLEEYEGGSTPDYLKGGLLSDAIRFNELADELSPRIKESFEKFCEKLLFKDYEDLQRFNEQLDDAGLQGALSTLVLSWIPGLDGDQGLSEEQEANGLVCSLDYLDVKKYPEELKAFFRRVYFLTSVSPSDEEIRRASKLGVVFTSKGLLVKSCTDLALSRQDGTGVLTKRAQMELIESEVTDLEDQLAKLQSEMDRCATALQNAIFNRREIEAELQNLSTENQEKIKNYELKKQEYTLNKEQYEKEKAQIDTLISKDKRILAEIQKLGQDRLAYAEEQLRIRADLEELTSGASSIEERREELARVRDEKKVDVVRVQTKLQGIEENFLSVEDRRNRLEQSVDRKIADRIRLEEEVDKIKTEHQEALSMIEDLLGKREAFEQQLTSKRHESQALLGEIREVETELRSLTTKSAHIEKDMSEAKVAGERFRLMMQSALDQAREKYHMDLYQVDPVEDESVDQKNVSKEVEKLREKIEKMGSINMLAIEEYDELMNRLEFILTQRTEVLESIEIIKAAIVDIEETSKKKFFETYEIINKEFTELFPILFPGGDARLDLTLPEDLLQTGVEIMARLPGKKAQRMTLLSGGEKALTAISLIFALLKTKPTPFCFLDEVDAPLDEANVGRYNAVLQSLSSRFQFIVITHNRRTMEVLDTLFGVTMQEPGVSKVVGVDMRKDIPDHLKKAFKEDSKKEPSRVGASRDPEL